MNVNRIMAEAIDLNLLFFQEIQIFREKRHQANTNDIPESYGWTLNLLLSGD